MPNTSQQFKTPRLYKIAAKIIRTFEENGSSLKSLIFSAKHPNKDSLSALVNETLKYKNVIQKLTDEIELFEKEPLLDKTIAFLLIYELLYSKKGCLRGESKAVNAILNHENEIRDAFNSLDNIEDTSNQPVLPRYVRVNTLKISIEEIIEIFVQEDYNYIEYSNTSNYFDVIGNLSRWDFVRDIHIKDMLVFHPKQHFHSNPLYIDGQILLQDKASCLPVVALMPSPGSSVIDACAAPGMKTTFLAAIMQNNGKIYANDFNSERLKTLRTITSTAGVDCCQISLKDFTKMDPSEYCDVEYILLDPSCSGSGIVSRNDSHRPSKERLNSLAKFQIKLLKHALSFQSVKKVVYSTCSIEEDENENVVSSVLEECADEFRVTKILEEWPTRGIATYKFGLKCIRSTPEDNLTNGFFVAMFKRRKQKRIHAECEDSLPIESQIENDHNEPRKKCRKKSHS